MRGRRGLISIFTSLPEHPEDRLDTRLRRRRHSSSGDRETWTRKLEYFFASLGYAVGLGNIWRFPYLCYRNGGGAFLIPYTLTLIAVGFPMLYLEMAFGQFASLGPITIWRVCPLFKGIGYAIVVVMVLVNIYYNVLNTYALYFLFASITNELPWATCGHEWNTKYCMHTVIDWSANGTNITSYSSLNLSDPQVRMKLKTPTEEYFHNHLLNATSGIDDLGSVQWSLLICLMVSWFTCFICLFKGIKSMGKVVIFTTLLSYIILTILLIRGCTLPGAWNGIVYYLYPSFEKLGCLQVWGEASAQAIASLSLGMGGWITLSSYNKFSNKCNWDVFLIGIGNALTSFYAGFVIFSVVGYMAEIKGLTNMDNVTAQGPGLAFVAYPEGLAMIPGAPLWSVCFFFMMFTVGLDSLFGQVEVIAAGIIDEYPDYLRPRRKVFTLCLCCMMFLMGIPLVTQGGIYVVTLLDWYTLLFSFSVISLAEIVVIIYIYGYNQFATDIEIMIGSTPLLFYKVTWVFVTPATLICVVIFLAKSYAPAYYGDYTFPGYAVNIGWVLAIVPTVCIIPTVMLVMFFWKMDFQILFKSGNCGALKEEFIQKLVLPTEDWGPALPENRDKYDRVTACRRQSQLNGDRNEIQKETVFDLEDGSFNQPDGSRAVRFAESSDNHPPAYSTTATMIPKSETAPTVGSEKMQDDPEETSKTAEDNSEADNLIA